MLLREAEATRDFHPVHSPNSHGGLAQCFEMGNPSWFPPGGWLGSLKDLGHPLLPLMVHIGRKLESQVEPAQKPGHCDQQENSALYLHFWPYYACTHSLCSWREGRGLRVWNIHTQTPGLSIKWLLIFVSSVRLSGWCSYSPLLPESWNSLGKDKRSILLPLFWPPQWHVWNPDHLIG